MALGHGSQSFITMSNYNVVKDILTSFLALKTEATSKRFLLPEVVPDKMPLWPESRPTSRILIHMYYN